MSDVYQHGTPINLVERFYLVDPLTGDATLADPTTVTFTIRAPDGTETSYVNVVDVEVDNPDPGVYVCTIAPPAAGHYTGEVVGTGAVATSSPFSFRVLPSSLLEPAAATIEFGPCEPWIVGADVAARCGNTDPDVLDSMDAYARAVSGALYELSGREFPGRCHRTVRPCRDRCSCWDGVSGGMFYWAAAGDLPGAGMWRDECGDTCGCGTLARVKLAGDVRQVTEVKIDGAVVDDSTYRLDGNRWLVRLDDPGPPVLKRLWPACQNIALADDQPGTFSVTYSWGVDPPEIGVQAAAALACELWKASSGMACALPVGATKIVRQGVTVDRKLLGGWLSAEPQTGIPVLDLFLRSYANAGGQRRPAVWSPDVPRFAREVG